MALGDIRDFVANNRSQGGKPGNSSQLYQPLKEGEIRVLELHPGKLDTPLRGSLHIVSIDFSYPAREVQYTLPFNNPANTSRGSITRTRITNHAVSLVTGKPVWYTALSYVWGPPVFEQVITFEHGFIRILKSLAGALRLLRSEEKSVFVWTDQICINQPDLVEKAQQIPLMGLIYAHATNTLIWLGENDGEDPVRAFDLMETIFARLQGTDAQVTPAEFGRLNFPSVLDRAWWAIHRLLRRSWFTRLWTIQEAVLSTRLFLKCGQAGACWDDFSAWCHCLREAGILCWLTNHLELDHQYGKGEHVKLLPPLGAVVDSLQADRVHCMTSPHKTSMLSTLVSTRYAQATQPKDKIYGIIGIAESEIIPDYSFDISVRETYHEACLTQLPRFAYEILSCVDHEQPLRPSWVPDWSTPRLTEALGYSTKAWALYCAGGRPVTGNQRPSAVLNNDKKELTLAGKIFDTIATLGCVVEDPVLDIVDPQNVNRDLALCMELALGSGQSYACSASTTSIYNAFFHTLLAGRDGSGVSEPSLDHSEVFGLILDSTTGRTLSLPGQTMSSRRERGHFTLEHVKARKPAKILEDLQTALQAALKMRRFAVTRQGYFALVPRGAQVGDELVVFDRACVPFVVRRDIEASTVNKFELLGEAYVHGVMQGEVMDMEEIRLGDVTIL